MERWDDGGRAVVFEWPSDLTLTLTPLFSPGPDRN